MKTVRLLIYEGDPDWVINTLRKSLKDGKHDMGKAGSIKVVTLGELPISLIEATTLKESL